MRGEDAAPARQVARLVSMAGPATCKTAAMSPDRARSDGAAITAPNRPRCRAAVARTWLGIAGGDEIGSVE